MTSHFDPCPLCVFKAQQHWQFVDHNLHISHIIILYNYHMQCFCGAQCQVIGFHWWLHSGFGSMLRHLYGVQRLRVPSSLHVSGQAGFCDFVQPFSWQTGQSHRLFGLCKAYWVGWLPFHPITLLPTAGFPWPQPWRRVLQIKFTSWCCHLWVGIRVLLLCPNAATKEMSWDVVICGDQQWWSCHRAPELKDSLVGRAAWNTRAQKIVECRSNCKFPGKYMELAKWIWLWIATTTARSVADDLPFWPMSTLCFQSPAALAIRGSQFAHITYHNSI